MVGGGGGPPKQSPGLSWMSILLRIELECQLFSRTTTHGAHNAQEWVAAPTDYPLTPLGGVFAFGLWGPWW